ncbi:MAG: hypothetical protein HC810_06330, partial [Acaryochloridaceae cyanobacterium RL_2_7]|nr:hypothetical protein [Acaryochloridaceae cyanobacterium RL_2_7]
TRGYFLQPRRRRVPPDCPRRSCSCVEVARGRRESIPLYRRAVRSWMSVLPMNPTLNRLQDYQGLSSSVELTQDGLQLNAVFLVES